MCVFRGFIVQFPSSLYATSSASRSMSFSSARWIPPQRLRPYGSIRAFSELSLKPTSYYDSQSARWITPHDHNVFILDVVGEKSNLINITVSATSPQSSLAKIASSFTTPNPSTQKHIRIRATISNFENLSPIDTGMLAAKCCDAGAEEIFLANQKNHNIDDLVGHLEEVLYVDAPGGAMLGRLGLNFVTGCEEFDEEVIRNIGVRKFNVSRENLGDEVFRKVQ